MSSLAPICAPLTDPALISLAVGLSRIGWEVRNVDIDLVAGRAVVELHRNDGRWVYFTADDHGRAAVERWQRVPIVTRYRGGPECDGFRDDFLGRTRAEGARSGLRSLCAYVADNPAPGRPAIGAADVRALLAPIMR